MEKRKIDFSGPSLQDLGLENQSEKMGESGIANDGNTENGNTKNGNGNNDKTQTQKPLGPEIVRETISGNTVYGNAVYGITENANAKKTRKTVYPKLIRDYLYAALGDNERAEIKISVMEKDLDINPKTLYKYLKVLRETEFFITKLQYSTEIRRR